MKVKDLLSALKGQISLDPDITYRKIIENVEKTHSANKTKLFRLLFGSIVSIVVLALVGTYTYHYFKFDTSYNIVGDTADISPIVYVAANQQNNYGVAANSSVTIVTKDSISVKELKSHLSVSPSVDYQIKKSGTNRFILTFDEDLDQNRSYIISSVTENATIYRWSLQTQADFKIESVTPSDLETDVECNANIQITFSESGVNFFQESFSIYPAVEGEFSHRGRTWCFTPNKPLLPYTTYTVTVSGEICGNEDIPLGSDYTFSFTTGENDERFAYIEKVGIDTANVYNTNQIPHIRIHAKGLATTTADLTVYKLPDAQSYIDLHSKYCQTSVISSKIIEIVAENDYPIHSQFSSSAIPDPQADGAYYINYPKELESGYYVTEIVWDDIKLYQLLQAGDLSVHAETHNNTLTLWVNNIQTKLPVANAQIIADKEIAKTDYNGLASIATTNIGQNGYAYLSITSENLPPYILYCNVSDSVNVARNEYNYYLYTNNTVYTIGDVIKLWGIVTKENSNISEPAVSITTDWDENAYPIELEDNGAFYAEIPTDRAAENAQISLNINEQPCLSQNITICADTPLYVLNATQNKHVYADKENATVNISATQQNGLPISTVSGTLNKQPITFDINGKATVTFPANYGEGQTTDASSNCAPVFLNNQITLSGAQEITLPSLIFKCNEYIDGNISDLKAGSCTLSVKTNRIDFAKLNQLSDAEFINACNDLKPTDYLGEIIDKSVTVEIHNVSYERKQNGTYFDTYSGKLQFKYDYSEKDVISKTMQVQTINGELPALEIPLPAKDGYRYLRLTMKDAAGTECYKIIYIDQPIIHDATAYTFDHHMERGEKLDKVTISVYDPTGKSNLQDGAFIYTLTYGNQIKTVYSKEAKSTFDYTDEMGSLVRINGVYFDGGFIRPIEPTVISNPQDNLKITLTTDKDSYAPNETVTAELFISDNAGKPIKNAPFVLNLSAGDNINQQIIREALEKDSASDTLLPNGTRSGSIAFISGKTNGNGKATVSFTLPNSITQQTLIVQTISKGSFVGFYQSNIAAVADLQISAAEVTNAKPSDDCVVAFNCTSSSLKATDLITSVVEIFSKDTTVKTITLTHAQITPQYVNLGKLQLGTYSAKITSNFGEITQIYEFSFEIKSPSRDPHLIQEFSEQEHASIILVDKAHKHYADLLNKLLLNGGQRLDEVLGRTFVLSKLQGIEPSENPLITETLKAYTKDYGYTLYKTDEVPNLLLTARIAALFPDNIDQAQLSQYFDAVLRDSETKLEGVLCALWGKAILGEAVEKDLNYYYAEGNGFTQEQQLYFALAYAYGGNQEKANSIYTNRIKTLLKSEAEMLYIQPEDEKHTELCNALLSALANRISAKEAPAILSCLIMNESNTTLLPLASISYIKEFTPAIEGNNIVTLTDESGDKTIQYAKISPVFILPQQQIINMVDSSDNSNILAYCPFVLQANEQIDVISAAMLPETTLNANIDIAITLTPAQIKSGKVYVSLPNSLLYLRKFTSSSKTAVVNETNANELEITASDDKSVTITLHCKAITPGEYSFDSISLLGTDGKYHLNAPLPLNIIDPNATVVEPNENEVHEEDPEATDETIGDQADPLLQNNTSIDAQTQAPTANE